MTNNTPVQSSCNANGSGASYVVGQVAQKGWPGPNSAMSGGKRRKRKGNKTAKRRSGKRMKGGDCGCSSPVPFTGGKKSRRSAKRRSAKRGKYGGFMGVLKEAIVPFSLYALQKRSQRKTSMPKRSKTYKKRFTKKNTKR
jgi:hypothetical protein